MFRIVPVIFIVTALSKLLGNAAFRVLMDTPADVSYSKHIFYSVVVHVFLWPELLLELFSGTGNLSGTVRWLSGLLGWSIFICVFYLGLKRAHSNRDGLDTKK